MLIQFNLADYMKQHEYCPKTYQSKRWKLI